MVFFADRSSQACVFYVTGNEAYVTGTMEHIYTN